MSETWKTVKSVVLEKEKVALPLFNVVDENDSTQDKLAKAVSQVWGIEYGFLNSTMSSLVQQFAKVSREWLIERKAYGRPIFQKWWKKSTKL